MWTETQRITLQALVNRIIPPDEYPGGWEAGVGDYLFGQFERDLKDQVTSYQQGLDALEAEAQAIAGQLFSALDPAEQDALAGADRARPGAHELAAGPGGLLRHGLSALRRRVSTATRATAAIARARPGA